MFNIISQWESHIKSELDIMISQLDWLKSKLLMRPRQRHTTSSLLSEKQVYTRILEGLANFWTKTNHVTMICM